MKKKTILLKRNSIFCVRTLNFCDQFFTYLVVTREKKDRNSAGNRKYILEDDQYPFFFFFTVLRKGFRLRGSSNGRRHP